MRYEKTPGAEKEVGDAGSELSRIPVSRFKLKLLTPQNFLQPKILTLQNLTPPKY